MATGYTQNIKVKSKRKAPVRESILQFIRESGLTGRRFSEIQRFYVESVRSTKFIPVVDRGYGCIMLIGHGKLLDTYCVKKDGRWVLKELLENRNGEGHQG